MTKRVVIEPEAERELLAARDWYERQEPGLGQELVACAREVLGNIAAGEAVMSPVPEIPREAEVARVLMRRFPSAVVVVEGEDAVFVVAVAHLRRRPGYWLDRETE